MLVGGLFNRLYSGARREFATAANTDATIRIVNDFYIAIFTTHIHSSFLFSIQEAENKCKITKNTIHSGRWSRYDRAKN